MNATAPATATATKKPTPTTTPLAANVRKLRTAMGWSQEHLAEAARLDVRTVQRVEAGEPASGETQQALASVLETSVQELNRDRIDVNSPEWEAKLEELQKRFHVVPLDLVKHAGTFDVANGAMTLRWYVTLELKTAEQEDAVAQLEEFVKDMADLAVEFPAKKRLEAYREALAVVERLAELGVAVAIGTYDSAETFRLPDGTNSEALEWSTLVVVISKRSDPKLVAVIDKRAPLF